MTQYALFNYGILEFQKRHPLTPRKSRIPKTKSRIPRDCFASLAMTRILEFYRDPPVKLGDDRERDPRVKPEDDKESQAGG